MASSVAVPAEEPYTPVSFKGASHALKLRASFATSDRLRVEAGYDLGLNKAAGSRPWGSLLFQVTRAEMLERSGRVFRPGWHVQGWEFSHAPANTQQVPVLAAWEWGLCVCSS